MKPLKTAAVFLLSVIVLFPAFSQDAGSQGKEGSNDEPDFFLVTVLETAFSGELRWRPDWPADIPPDGFSLQKGDRPRTLELSNETTSYAVKRDSGGRLVEFPFFFEDSYAKVEAAYSETGAIKTMVVSIKNYASESDDKSAQAEEKTMNIEFPDGFLPYSDLSPGGSFPPIKVTSDDSIYYVFIFESPAFLTETWYDGNGEMLAFCKASVNTHNGAWRIRSLQIYSEAGVKFEDRFFDSFGNISEIRIEDRIFTSHFTGADRPVFWNCRDYQYEIRWDAVGFLRSMKAKGGSDDAEIEYRYEYELDPRGNWIKRIEAAYALKFDLIVPQPSLSRGIWNRRIED